MVLSGSQQSGGWLTDLAYVGQSLATLGGGRTQPGTTAWELVTVLVGVNGMIVLTLSVSFVLNTTQTVASGRAFLAHIAAVQALGGRPGEDLKPVADLVSQLNSVPHALYYSAPDPCLRLPQGLERFAGWWAEHRGDLTGLRVILRGLPNLEVPENASDEEFLAALSSWSENFVF